MAEAGFKPSVYLSTAYFPPVSYFSFLLKFSSILIDIQETYSKQTWRNRCTIMSGNGPLSLTVPVEKPHGNHTKTQDIVISNHLNWRKNHWRTIISAYNNAPFFLYYKDLVEGLICSDSHKLLHSLNDNILKQLIDEIGFNVKIEFSREYIKHAESGLFIDLRKRLSPKNPEINKNQVVCFPPYYQVFNDRFGFHPNLSILDLIFNLGPETLNYLESIEVKL